MRIKECGRILTCMHIDHRGFDPINVRIWKKAKKDQLSVHSFSMLFDERVETFV